jgi:polyisoprenoid-binding protein YceI
MLKPLVVAVAALILCAPAAIGQSAPMPAGVYQMDRGHASLHWKINHLGLSNYTARFTRFEASLDIDPAKPESARLTVAVDPTSIRTDYPFAERKDFDKELIEDADFFNASKFPKITFISTKIERTGEKTAKVTGDLVMLGISKPLTLDVVLNGAKEHPGNKKPALGFSATAKLKRSDWGLTTRAPFLGDEVSLLIEAEFIKS